MRSNFFRVGLVAVVFSVLPGCNLVLEELADAGYTVTPLADGGISITLNDAGTPSDAGFAVDGGVALPDAGFPPRPCTGDSDCPDESFCHPNPEFCQRGEICRPACQPVNPDGGVCARPQYACPLLSGWDVEKCGCAPLPIACDTVDNACPTGSGCLQDASSNSHCVVIDPLTQ